MAAICHALIGGMLDKGIAASEIQVIDPGSEARARLHQAYGVVSSLCCRRTGRAGCAAPGRQAAADAGSGCALAGAALGNALVISIAAGLDLATLARWLGGISGWCGPCRIRRRWSAQG